MFPLTPLEANFVDSLKSPEPRPPAGKPASPNFPLKSGLTAEDMFVYGEDRADFPILQQEYFDRFQPFTVEERFQVDTLLRAEWSLRRLFRVEAHLWEYHAMCSDRSSGVPLGEGFNRASEVFMRLQRRVNASEQTYKEAYKELGRLQGMRTSPSAPAITLADVHLPLQPQPLPPQTTCGASAFACQPHMPPQAGLQPQPLEAQPPQPEPQPPQTNSETAPLGSFLNSPPSPPAVASAAAGDAASAPSEPQPGSVAATPVVCPELRHVFPPPPPRRDPADLARWTRPEAFQ